MLSQQNTKICLLVGSQDCRERAAQTPDSPALGTHFHSYSDSKATKQGQERIIMRNEQKILILNRSSLILTKERDRRPTIQYRGYRVLAPSEIFVVGSGRAMYRCHEGRRYHMSCHVYGRCGTTKESSFLFPSDLSSQLQSTGQTETMR